MTWFVLVVIVMAGLGYWNWQKTQDQLQVLRNSSFNITADLKGEPRLVIDSTQRQLALVSPQGYRIIPMSAIVHSEMEFDRGVQIDKNFRIELQLIMSERSAGPVVYENETLARAALEKLHSALR
ncbi:hypothetical protein [Neptunomonas qingdaonensis]|uniref:Uncharacterized protein n=1 Tax=Neptunomonas qingdaonensis TaxID=1045558 RepID=A0A1I2RYN2_9GAMM|nr:hypothetical protein [Neptunomonas qingdaonensis]SFG45668.1 hypothetical protein SAMN05216175_10727 [Neptunomonas qingdaonensis]